MTWILLNGGTPDHLGFIPSFLDINDARSAREQFSTNYVSGWSAFAGFKLHKNGHLSYPGDPELEPKAMLQFRGELILVYDCAWVLVMQKDGTFEVSRMD